jgi:hypothetical protein
MRFLKMLTERPALLIAAWRIAPHTMSKLDMKATALGL